MHMQEDVCPSVCVEEVAAAAARAAMPKEHFYALLGKPPEVRSGLQASS